MTYHNISISAPKILKSNQPFLPKQDSYVYCSGKTNCTTPPVQQGALKIFMKTETKTRLRHKKATEMPGPSFAATHRQGWGQTSLCFSTCCLKLLFLAAKTMMISYPPGRRLRTMRSNLPAIEVLDRQVDE